MTESRTHEQSGCLVHGQILSPELIAGPIDCTIWDISQEGARLIIQEDITLPHEISISTPFGEEPRPAEICWRRQREVGIRLLKKAEAKIKGPVSLAEQTNAEVTERLSALARQFKDEDTRHAEPDLVNSAPERIEGTALSSNPSLFTYVGEDARILVTDDDPILREFARVYLTTPTTSVDVAESGEEGLKLLDAENFDIALVDLEMPGMGGLEMIKRLRLDPRHRDLPIVVVTGREDIGSIDMAYEAGATSFVTKPVNWRVMSYQLRYVLRAQRFYSARLC